MWKLGISLGAIGLLLCTALIEPASAKKGGGGGGGGGRGGAAHAIGGGGGGHGGGRAAIHRAAGPRIGGISRHSFSPHVVRGGHPGRSARAFARPAARTTYAGRSGTSRRAWRNPAANALAARGALRSVGVVRPFARPGFRRGHIGWAGALFWPYAYGDFFYYSLWPHAYEDPFWAYGYGDIYQTVFWPYGYDEFIRTPGTRLAARPGVYDDSARNIMTSRLAQLCANEAQEVAGWPIDQIQAVVQPNEQQSAALDELGNATIKANEAIKAGCPTNVAFTPTGRLDAMEKRIAALIQAVAIVQPTLEKFYISLTDDQKARFNAMGTPSDRRQLPRNAPSAEAACNSDAAEATPWPTEEIERVVRPTGDQHAGLDHLRAAALQAANIIKAACPADAPSTPPGRLAAVAKRLDAMQQAVQTVRTAIDAFYGSLDDEQKARFNGLGRQRSTGRT